MTDNKKTARPRGTDSARVKKLLNMNFEPGVVTTVCYSRGYGSRGGQRIAVEATSRELFDAAVTAIKKERRRRRHTGGRAFEFRVILRGG